MSDRRGLQTDDLHRTTGMAAAQQRASIVSRHSPSFSLISIPGELVPDPNLIPVPTLQIRVYSLFFTQ
jgi:hypothetical protein